MALPGPVQGTFSLIRGARLPLRIACYVFLAIFAVEAAILVPSYRNYERDLIGRIDEVARTALAFALEAGPADPLAAAQAVLGHAPLAGGALYDMAGRPVGTFGEAPRARPGTRRGGAGCTREQAGTRCDVVWRPAETGLPLTVVARLDTRRVPAALAAFLERIGGLVLLISAFVCAVTIAILGRSVLGPVLAIRRNLFAAMAEPAEADRYLIETASRDEMADLAGTLNELLRRLAKTHREELATMIAVVEQSTSAILAFDEAGRLIYANRACLALCEAAEPGRLAECGPPRLALAPDAPPRELFEVVREAVVDIEATAVLATGRRLPCLVRADRLVADGERPIRYFVSLTDISALKAAYRSLELRNIELAASNRAKSDFLANVSHELRTPLNAIIGFAEVLRAGPSEALAGIDRRGYVEHIHESGCHLLGIINDILDLSKIEAGRLELADEVFDVAEIIEGSLRLVHGRAAERAIDLRREVADRLPLLRGDALKMKQVLVNLLSNAVKFTPNGGAVTVAARRGADGHLAISVADTGIGIAAADLARVFEPFVQVEGTLSRQFDGTGLGLPLSRAMVEMHAGTLELASEPGAGTEATVRLPPERLVA